MQHQKAVETAKEFESIAIEEMKEIIRENGGK